MEKTTKKSKKKSRRLKKRIGIIAVGGLSFVLTICLSVGATLAWFAGSSWASNDLYMGGPVYVEMAGAGKSGSTTGTGEDEAQWVGGAGNLQIEAAAARSTGSVPIKTEDGKYVKDTTGTGIPNNILLPGQKVQIYSQARVYSTAVTDSRADGAYDNNSSGANTANTSNPKTGTAQYVDGKGRVTSTTTSVLRARFSISIEFDPSVGFNNFTDEDYMRGYPKQSTDYSALKTAAETVTHTDSTYFLEVSDALKTAGDKTWEGALSTSDEAGNAGNKVWSQTTSSGVTTIKGRRDGVAKGTWTSGTAEADLTSVKSGAAKSIYKWRYCSATEHTNAATTAGIEAMGKPFDGSVKVNGVGYYGVWITDSNGDKVESDAFYKARTNAYLQSYVEFYENEYGNTVTRTIQNSINSLDTALNNDFKKLINDSSDDIQNGKVYGYTVENGVKTAVGKDGTVGGALSPQNASWLYIDPSIGNDTNTNEISTSTGGWWYLVESTGTMAADSNKITIIADAVNTDANDNGLTDELKAVTSGINTPNTTLKLTTTAEAGKATRGMKEGSGDGAVAKFGPADENRKLAKLYEIDPTEELNEVVGMNGDKKVKKVVSVAFPFVNGTFALPGDALTNIFANAKISFQISFQAIQAFFPYTTSIDGVDYKDSLFGVAKVLNIGNAIPIFNEAFDYQESFTDDSSRIPL